jgi:hypothetical protein
MSLLQYPAITEYQLPKKNILVVGCIDLRLTDDLLRFLHFDNLVNRYDHFSLAGTALTLSAASKVLKELFKPDVLKTFNSFAHWKQSLFEHIEIAIALHDIQDIYIVEHEDCGAYKEFLINGVFTSHKEEVSCHKKFATALSKDIRAKYKLNVHCFIIDLRGNVVLLDTAMSK